MDQRADLGVQKGEISLQVAGDEQQPSFSQRFGAGSRRRRAARVAATAAGTKRARYNGRIRHVVEGLKQVFEACKEVKLAYLFGSRAQGTAGPLSDHDFAVYLDERDPKRAVEIRLELLDELQRRLKTDKVEVVALNLAESPELKYNIIVTGTLLYEEEPYKVLVEPRILNEYFDFHEMLKRHDLTKA